MILTTNTVRENYQLEQVRKRMLKKMHMFIIVISKLLHLSTYLGVFPNIKYLGNMISGKNVVTELTTRIS